MADTLKKVVLRGFKTIRELEFEPRPLNILIGPNGVGKSNFISFFRLLSWMLTSPGGLQSHVASLGGANALLHKGARMTRQIETELVFDSDAGTNVYEFWLSYAAGDTFIFTSECYHWSRFELPGTGPRCSLDAGHREAKIIEKAEAGDKSARVMLAIMRKWKVFQFHNTSDTSRIRQKWNAADGRWLREDGGNLAPFLLHLKEDAPQYFSKALKILRMILPFFADFELQPDRYGQLLLTWRERDNDVLFNASQASDGMLRCMALVALLAQPETDLPPMLIFDEPELGLHPYAEGIVADLLRAAAEHVQVFVATQSPSFLDHFSPEDVVVVDREKGESVFRRLSDTDLNIWIDEYSLSECWEKNLIGGRP